MRTFFEERASALRSLDFKKLSAYMKKYGERAPAVESPIFWAGVHKARVMCPQMTKAEREYSRVWLRANGWQVPGEEMRA